ncbi:Hypothetical predicted protein [Octopus vulgaris]|uniref:Uncharacterized protein n=1 Tax=Octopus vulgaris TaxID=6645 RepID=A0AA36FDV6_OCTVU|nr:Hypothetical predicted protein [Octopus vulgaris]
MVIPEDKYIPTAGNQTFNSPAAEKVEAVIPDANLEKVQLQRLLTLHKKCVLGKSPLETISYEKTKDFYEQQR